jgi:hypothetical protein
LERITPLITGLNMRLTAGSARARGTICASI